jgi:hypothetical protein
MVAVSVIHSAELYTVKIICLFCGGEKYIVPLNYNFLVYGATYGLCHRMIDDLDLLSLFKRYRKGHRVGQSPCGLIPP